MPVSAMPISASVPVSTPVHVSSSMAAHLRLRRGGQRPTSCHHRNDCQSFDYFHCYFLCLTAMNIAQRIGFSALHQCPPREKFFSLSERLFA